MKKKISTIIILFLTYTLVYFGGYKTNEIVSRQNAQKLQNSVIYEIEVNVEKINLRKDIDLSGTPIKQVYKGETLKVVEYREGNNYNWYRVIYDESQTGWIASGKEISWVKIIKNND